jgi:hypothetical protein
METDALVRAASRRGGFIREGVCLKSEPVLESEPVLGEFSTVPPMDLAPIDGAAGRQRALTERVPERGPVVNKPLRPRLPPVATGPFRNLGSSGRQ